MKTINLTSGKVAFVDDQDFDFINSYKWRAIKGTNTFHAARSICLPGRKYKSIQMHHLILPLEGDLEVDHKDCNGLNNQRENLRLCTRSQNKANQFKFKKKCSSKFKGVSWAKRDKRWQSRIKYKGKQMALGNFKIETDAAKAYDSAATKLFGEFAKLNFPGGTA